MNKVYFPVVHLIITTGHWITDQVSKVLKDDGITEPQYNVLRILKQAHPRPLTVQEIQRNMVQRSSNVTRIIDKLLNKEYVERKECAANRRKMDISITPSGLETLEKLDQKVYAFHEPMMSKLTKTELETLKQLMTKLKSSQYE